MRPLAAIVLTMLAAAAQAQPRIEWLTTTYDFGAFDEDDGLVSGDIRFVNTGDEPLSILSVRTSCGCTTASMPRDIIMPGDTAAITAIYNPTGRPGRFDKKITVDTNGEPARSTLHVTGVVIGAQNTLRSRYPVDAGAVKLRTTTMALGTTKKGTAKSDFIEVYNATDEELTPVWEGVPRWISVTAPQSSLPPNEKMSYSLVYSADRAPLYGLQTDTIYLRPRPGDDRVPIAVMANVIEDFSTLTDKQLRDAPIGRIATESVDLGTVAADDHARGSFSITNMGHDRLEVRRVMSADPGITVSIDRSKLKSGQTATVTILADPAAMPGDIINARVQVITNDPLNPVQIVRIVGLINHQ